MRRTSGTVLPWKLHSARSGRSPLICFDGIDGSGKSTQVKLLRDRLQAEGRETVLVRSDGLPYVSRPAVYLAKRRLGRRRQPGGRHDSFADYLSSTNSLFRNHRVLRRSWTDVSLFEHAVEATLTVTPHLARGQAVICDRYLYKSVVNLAVLLGLEPDQVSTLLRHPALRLVPQPSLYIIVDAPEEVAFARKDDIPSIEYIRRRRPIFRAIAESSGAPLIDGTLAPEVIAEQIWELVQPALERAPLERVAYAGR